jgi:hypothetical protein
MSASEEEINDVCLRMGEGVSVTPPGATHEVCSSWEDFQRRLRVRVGKVIGQRIYRGQRDPRWRLQSIFERWLWRMAGKEKWPERNVRELFAEGSFEAIRDQYIVDFRRHAKSLPGIGISIRDDQWWPLARHYGTVTPLLDWTLSPYIAAFFAFEDYLGATNEGLRSGLGRLGLGGGGGIVLGGDGAVAVWELIRSEDLRKHGELDVLSPGLPFTPVAERIRAQRSIFTWLNHEIHVDIESFLASKNLAHLLTCYELPIRDTGKAIGDLSRMGIDFARLFPDLEGAAIQANVGRLLEELDLGE